MFSWPLETVNWFFSFYFLWPWETSVCSDFFVFVCLFSPRNTFSSFFFFFSFFFHRFSAAGGGWWPPSICQRLDPENFSAFSQKWNYTCHVGEDSSRGKMPSRGSAGGKGSAAACKTGGEKKKKATHTHVHITPTHTHTPLWASDWPTFEKVKGRRGLFAEIESFMPFFSFFFLMYNHISRPAGGNSQLLTVWWCNTQRLQGGVGLLLLLLLFFVNTNSVKSVGKMCVKV